MTREYSADTLRAVTRRHFFADAGLGLGSIALTALMNRELLANPSEPPPPAPANPLAPRPPHFAPKAKRIVYLFMAGAPSSLELFDPKPELDKLDGQKCPESLLANERFAFIKGIPNLLGTKVKFARHGNCGATVSELLPHTAKIVDDLAFVRSMHTNFFNHGPAQIYMNTGHQIVGRPSMGSWLTYGIGSECDNLPGFVVLLSGKVDPGAGNACWSSGFLPTVYQGVEFRSQGDPVLCVSNPPGVDPEVRRRSIDAVKELNERRLREVGDPEIATRIQQYELAYKMQTSVPELADIASEPKEVHELYGTEPGKSSFANNCLLARRLLERGVRFVQLYHRGWDHHGTSEDDDLEHSLPKLCAETDRAAAALVTDLKRRGLLEDTLVVWGGEFGRTPMNEGRSTKVLGRDHHVKCFTVWMAGGGVKPGITIGKTDDIGFNIVEDPIHVHDLHATILHLLGIEHTKLTYFFQGRDYRLTDVHGVLVKKLLA